MTVTARTRLRLTQGVDFSRLPERLFYVMSTSVQAKAKDLEF